MRKILLPLALIMSIQIAFAQDGEGFRFGLTASPQISWFRVDNPALSNAGTRIGLEYGLTASYFFTENYGFHTGLLVSLTGGNIHNNAVVNGSTYPFPYADNSYKIQYLNIPLAMKLKTNEIGYITYWGMFGLVPDFRIRARLDRETVAGIADLENEDVREDIGLFNLGLTVGGGIEYSLADHFSLLFGIYYKNGFINVVQDDDDEKVTLNTLGLRVGALF